MRQAFTVPTSLQKSVDPLRRRLMLRATGRGCGTADVRRNSGICLGSRRHGWVLGHAESIISTGGKDALSRFEVRIRKCGWYGLLVH